MPHDGGMTSPAARRSSVRVVTPAAKRERASLVAEVVRRLADAYGLPEWRPHGDAVGELVLTILSQNTSDANSGRAFARLLERYPSWEAVAAAPLPELVATIQPGGLAPTKAPRIQAALRDIRQRLGGYDLGFLREMPLAEARAWLRDIHGVGPKTVACVLMFALGRPVMPVDTHVFRVALRLGLIPARTATAAMTAEKAHQVLEAIVPERLVYAFHLALIKHGRRTCTAQRPACARCVLVDLCPSAAVYHPEVAAQRTMQAEAATPRHPGPRQSPSRRTRKP